MTFGWRIMEESAATETGGDVEASPPTPTFLFMSICSR